MTYKVPEVPKEVQNRKHVEYLSNKYSKPSTYIENIVSITKKYAVYDFPTHLDVLSVIAVESSFNKHAVSSAKAKGLMQILYKPTTFEEDQNILDGVILLREYYQELGSAPAAVQAYNVGITAYKKGKRAPNYLKKFNKEKRELHNAISTA